MADRNRIITPTTDPDRWSPAEIDLFNAGKCSWQVEYGNWGPPKHCGKPSKRGASFGHCDEHNDRHLEEYWPDGSPRR